MAIKPFVSVPSSTQFYVPPHIQTDFMNYLDTDVPNANYTFEIVEDWTLRGGVGYTPQYLRAETYPINWKSNFGNADNTVNFKTDLRVPVNKGDIAVRSDGQIRQLNWKVEKHVNDQSTQAQECNLLVTIERKVDETVDPATGYVVVETDPITEKPIPFNPIQTIVSSHPCAAYQYDGRPYYDTNINAPGIAPDVLTMLQIQWNSGTANIRIGDEFDWFVDRYRISNLDYGGIDVDHEHGVLKIHAKKVAGGSD